MASNENRVPDAIESDTGEDTPDEDSGTDAFQSDSEADVSARFLILWIKHILLISQQVTKTYIKQGSKSHGRPVITCSPGLLDF